MLHDKALYKSTFTLLTYLHGAIKGRLNRLVSANRGWVLDLYYVVPTCLIGIGKADVVSIDNQNDMTNVKPRCNFPAYDNANCKDVSEVIVIS